MTGVAGFIGSNFVYYYLNKNPEREIIGLDKITYAGNLENLNNLEKSNRERFSLVKGDINDYKLLKKIFSNNEIDGVINFAAESHVDKSIENPSIFLETNILGTQTLLNICKKSWMKDEGNEENQKFLQISTDEVYGSLGSEGYFTEESQLDPRSPYSASKASADCIVKAYYHTYKFPMNITRCSNNYGPYQFPEKLIPLMISNALKHENLPVYGDGKQIRDWIYVDDHCKAIDLVYEKGKLGEVYNIGGYNERKNINVVKKIIEILNEITNDDKINDELIKHVTDRLGHDRRYGIDPTKIENELQWEHTLNFEQGLRKTIRWYLSNREWLENIISKKYLSLNESLLKEFSKYIPKK